MDQHTKEFSEKNMDEKINTLCKALEFGGKCLEDKVLAFQKNIPQTTIFKE